MVLGIDIDDVLTNTSQILEEFIELHADEFDNPEEIRSNKVALMKGDKSLPFVKEFIEKYYAEMIYKVTLKEDVVEVLTYLKQIGYKIVLITARGELLFEGAAEITKRFLQENNVPYDKLVLDAHDKLRACHDNNVTAMIDDSIATCEYISNDGIESYVFNSNVNKDIPTELPRISSLLEIKDLFDIYDEKRVDRILGKENSGSVKKYLMSNCA